MKSAVEIDCQRFSAQRPPVVLLGGLNVLRALGLGGIPVIVGSSDPHDVAFASRYCRGRLLLPPPQEARAVVDALGRFGARLAAALARRVPLFYSNDPWLRLVQDYRAELEAHYLLALNAPALADALIEKDRFQALAAERGVPVPRALQWEALAEVETPVLVKPRAKFQSSLSPTRRRMFGAQGKARIYPDGRAVLSDADARELRDELLLQDYIDGDDRQIWSFHGFADAQGELLDWFVGRKIRTYPELTGESSYVELAHDDAFAELGRQAVRALGLSGVFKIDFKRDARSGRFYVLEVNARYNLWHYLAAANGLNLPRTAYDFLVHGARPPAAGRYRTTHRWLHLRLDWLAYRRLAARGELSARAWLASLAAAPKVYTLFSWSDPMPVVHRARHLHSRLPRLGNAIRRWLSTAS